MIRILLLLAILVGITEGGSAFADEITIKWEADAQAVKYELRVARGREIVFNRVFKSPVAEWRGDLPYGQYRYQLRSFDSRGLASAWSEAIPFFVTPSAPTLLIPPNESKVLFRPKLGIAFKWSPVKGVKEFLIRVEGASKPVRATVRGTQAIIRDLTPGRHTWTVEPVVESSVQGEAMAGMNAKKSATFSFEIEIVKDAVEYDGDFQRVRLTAVRNGRRFNPGELVCLFKDRARTDGPIGCGEAYSDDERNVELKLLSQRVRLRAKERFLIGPMDESGRSPAALSGNEVFEIESQGTPFNFELHGGLMAGLNYFFPAGGFRFNLLSRTALGVRGFFSRDEASATTNASLLGGMVTLTQYFGERSFSGFFVDLAAGAVFFSAQNGGVSENSRSSASGSVGVGWQFRPAQQGFNASAMLGVQYIDPPKVTLAAPQTKNTLPLFTLFIGYAF